MSDQNIGKVVQVIGPVVDIEFPGGDLPKNLQCHNYKGRRKKELI